MYIYFSCKTYNTIFSLIKTCTRKLNIEVSKLKIYKRYLFFILMC